MREIREDLIKAHADRRFRSEYDYALFEYYRSAKVIAFLERSKVALAGRVLDAGCGGGGMPLSLAEHATDVVGIDPIDRFGKAGVTLAHERGLTNLHFARADGMALPFAAGSFDLVLSHAVIEHVPDATLYLRECRRVLKRGGHCYLSTAPYLSFAGAHLPRLRVPIPLHLLTGRKIAFRTFRFLARRAPWTLREPAHENSFIRDARRGVVKHDDLLEKVRVRRLRGQIAAAGLRVVREELHVTGTVRRLPAALGRWLRDSALTQDALIGNIEYVLTPDGDVQSSKSARGRREDSESASAGATRAGVGPRAH
jgi:SAM-dependent methyltransferase